MTRWLRIVTFTGWVGIGLLAASPTFAQDQRQNEPGKFDYYVLALSWSPSYCEASEECAGFKNLNRTIGGVSA
jgi:ribonuclease T2